MDTIIVTAGVSALQPLMTVAGVDPPEKDQPWTHATNYGIQQAVDITVAATRGNYIGPLVAAVTLVRLIIPLFH